MPVINQTSKRCLSSLTHPQPTLHPKYSLPTLISQRYQSDSTNTIPLPTQDKPWIPSTQSTLSLSKGPSGLERLPTLSILRNILLGTIFTTPLLFNLSLPLLTTIAHSKSALLNPDLNPLLKSIIKPLIYNQFCAGTTPFEIARTRDTIKAMGYSSIILCYGKELQVSSSPSSPLSHSPPSNDLSIWQSGNLETLRMLSSGDWLGIKLSGAGPATTSALMQRSPPSPAFLHAMATICAEARRRNCRIWIDAEQQLLQPAIDDWTIELMRRYNAKGCPPLVYNTVQAYLKCAREKLKAQFALSRREGWTLGVKLVRGAYISTDPRGAIWGTKAETDESYNGIVRDVIRGENLGVETGREEMYIFLAGHNPESVAAAWELAKGLGREGRLRVVPEFGQLQGMADELGCRMLRMREELLGEGGEGGDGMVVPRVYKCLTWGNVQECMQYLVRRVVENRGGADRMRDGLLANYAELRRRVLRKRVV